MSRADMGCDKSLRVPSRAEFTFRKRIRTTSAVDNISMFLNALRDTSPDGHNYRIIGEPVEASLGPDLPSPDWKNHT